ncbi:bifunctional nuclease family protein [Gordonia sp. NPDC058843]|uniref:bifunctional nuclease family protein n=1 Tax=Gordonia sp. NPDC058843 TaxID=3346648 RepID=UPI0036942237
MSEMRVVGIRVEPPQSQPVLLLREVDGERYLPIWIGQSEAASIALRQKGIEPPRPLTHDLIVNLIKDFGQTLLEVRIVDMQEGTFYAEMIFTGDLRVSARPSDSIAVAMRAEVPIIADEEVLAEAGLLIPDDESDEAPEAQAEGVKEDEVEKFKEFLDNVSPDDFKASGA